MDSDAPGCHRQEAVGSDTRQDARRLMHTLARGTKEAVNLSDRTKAYHCHELSDGWEWFTFCKKSVSSIVSWHNFKSNPWHNIAKRFPLLRRHRPKFISVRASRHHIFTQHRNNFPSAGANRIACVSTSELRDNIASDVNWLASC